MLPSHPPSFRIRVLRLFDAHYRDDTVPLILEMWSNEPAVVVKRHAMEILLERDRAAGLRLILAKGLTDLRAGARVATCAALGSEFSTEVTEALIGKLREDDSPWVRLQALRSLLVPGREVTKQQILEASKSEKSANVLALRDELL